MAKKICSRRVKWNFSDTASRRKDYKYIRQLEDEISLLKQLLVERDLEIALQDDLLKKKYP